MKQFGNPPVLGEPSPLSTNPPISEQFFHDPPHCPNFNNEVPPPWVPFVDVFRNVYKKTSMLESLFNKVTGLKACNFILKRLQHRSFTVNIAKYL